MSGKGSMGRGICAAASIFVQVPIIEFDVETFSPLIRESTFLMQKLPSAEIQVQFESSHEKPAKLAIQVRAGRSTSQGTPTRLFRSAHAKIGANCLSIIGHIEPGRTVRLYRQMH